MKEGMHTEVLKTARHWLFFAVLLAGCAFVLTPNAADAQGNTVGSAVSSVTGTNNSGNSSMVPSGGPDSIQDADTVRAGDIRAHYFKRYPYAKAAATHDILVPAASAPGTAALSGSTGSQANRLTRSASPGSTHAVAAYLPLSLYGVPPLIPLPYTQPQTPLIAKDTPATKRDDELFNDEGILGAAGGATTTGAGSAAGAGGVAAVGIPTGLSAGLLGGAGLSALGVGTQNRLLTTFGVPMSDSQFQIIDRENKQRFLELLFDPERTMWLSNTTAQMQTQAASNSMAGNAEQANTTAVGNILSASDSTGSSNSSGLGGAGSSLTGNSTAGSSITGTGTVSMGSLINIANENAGMPLSGIMPGVSSIPDASSIPGVSNITGSTTISGIAGNTSGSRTIRQSVWMVQQMYKYVSVPIAILLLLPGALLTQVKGQVAQAFKINQDDASSPFEGILRALIAVFLIGAIPLIVSASIDVGNALAYSCSPWVSASVIQQWAHEVLFNTSMKKDENTIEPVPGDSGTSARSGSSLSSVATGSSGQTGSGTSGGTNNGFLSGSISNFFSSISKGLSGVPGISSLSKGLNGILNQSNVPTGQGPSSNSNESQTAAENESYLSVALVLVFNMVNYLFSLAVMILGAFQLVFACYLYLLGPIAAALFAWPKVSKAYKDVFGDWANAIIQVSLWRFYWMIILAIMTQRILYILDNGGNFDLQWEIIVFTCLMGLMMWVPFSPWNFDPAMAFDQAMMASSQLAQAAGPALASAAQAAGVPQSTINAIGNEYNQIMAPMTQWMGSFEQADGGYLQTQSPYYNAPTSGASSGGSSGNNGGNNSPGGTPPTSTAPGAEGQYSPYSGSTSPPPSATSPPPTSAANMMPALSMPMGDMFAGQAGNTAAGMQNEQMVGQMLGGTQTQAMQTSTLPLTAQTQATAYVNPSAGQADTSQGAQQMASQYMPLLPPSATVNPPPSSENYNA